MVAVNTLGITLAFGGIPSHLCPMMMVEEFANSPPRALGDFSCALRGADANVLASHACALADIACGIEWVKRGKIACTFPNTLGRRSSALGRSFADISGTPANVSARAGWMGMSLGGRLGCTGGLGRGLGLAVLTRSVLGPDGKCESKEQDDWSLK
jgi:hypothetical protein